MSYDSIRISRERNGFEVCVTDPEIAKKNREDKGPWMDADASYQFETKEQALKFIESVIDKALPPDEYSAAFDKAAKEALNG